jgi:hypothetical protein
MDAGTLTVEILKAAAWPVATLLLALMFRAPVTNLFLGLRLKRLKRGDWEADFQETSAEVRREVAALASPVAGAGGQTPLMIDASDLSTGAPAVAAVVRAWNHVEALIENTAREAGVTGSTFPEKLRDLAEKGFLHPATVDAVNGLRIMRNLAVHSPEPLAQEKARDFIEMASGVAFAISMDLKKRLTAESGNKVAPR